MKGFRDFFGHFKWSFLGILIITIVIGILVAIFDYKEAHVTHPFVVPLLALIIIFLSGVPLTMLSFLIFIVSHNIYFRKLRNDIEVSNDFNSFKALRKRRIDSFW
jgi:cell division protein FtsW (lipid II flippase)